MTRGGAVLGMLLALGCASALVETDGRLRNEEHGYSVGMPDAAGGWQRTRVKGAVLAYERWGSDRMSLESNCGRPVAAPSVMARHLLIGVRMRGLLQAGPVEAAGIPGWTQTFDAAGDGETVRVKTVTVVLDDCAIDWVLSSTGDFHAAEVDFDAWWESFAAREGRTPR